MFENWDWLRTSAYIWKHMICIMVCVCETYIWKYIVYILNNISSSGRSRFPLVPTFLSSIFHTTLLLSFLRLFLPIVSPLLFPCARYPVWDTHLRYLVHKISVPHSLCWMVPCISVFLNHVYTQLRRVAV